MTFHAQRQCFQASHHKVAIKWTEHSPQHGGVCARLLDVRIFRANDHSARCITMTTHVLRHAVNNEIKAMFDGPDQVGRREGAIDNRNRINLLSRSADRIQVDQFRQWVGERFHVDHIGLLVSDDLPNFRTAQVAQDHLNPDRNEERA